MSDEFLMDWEMKDWYEKALAIPKAPISAREHGICDASSAMIVWQKQNGSMGPTGPFTSVRTLEDIEIIDSCLFHNGNAVVYEGDGPIQYIRGFLDQLAEYK